MACRMMKRIQFDKGRPSFSAACLASSSRLGGRKMSRRAEHGSDTPRVLASPDPASPWRAAPTAPGLARPRRILSGVLFFSIATPQRKQSTTQRRTEFGGTVVLENLVTFVEPRDQPIECGVISIKVQFPHTDQRLNSHASHALTTGQAARVVAGFQRSSAGPSPGARRSRVAFFASKGDIPCSDHIRRFRAELCQPFGRKLGEPRGSAGSSPTLSLGEIFGKPSHAFNIQHFYVGVKRIPGGIRG